MNQWTVWHIDLLVSGIGSDLINNTERPWKSSVLMIMLINVADPLLLHTLRSSTTTTTTTTVSRFAFKATSHTASHYILRATARTEYNRRNNMATAAASQQHNGSRQRPAQQHSSAADKMNTSTLTSAARPLLIAKCAPATIRPTTTSTLQLSILHWACLASLQATISRSRYELCDSVIMRFFCTS